MRLKKRWSQVLLVDGAVLDFIASVIPVAGERVLEIGAGTGNLTAWLAKKGARVTALEKDPDLAAELRNRFRGNTNVDVVEADALASDFNALQPRYIFGNLPYHLSSALLFKILDADAEEAVLLLQKEFAERLVAQPGDANYSRLSLDVQNRARVEIPSIVSRQSFRPVPRVDSAVVFLQKRKRRQHVLDDALVRALFQHKKQTVRNALTHAAKALGFDKHALRTALSTALPSDLLAKKAFELTPAETTRLARALRGLVSENKTGRGKARGV